MSAAGADMDSRVAAGVDSRKQSSGADSTYVRAEMAMPGVAASVDSSTQSSGADNVMKINAT